MTDDSMISRRAILVAMAGGLLGVPLAVPAQQPGRVYRIGFLWDSPAVWPGLSVVKGKKKKPGAFAPEKGPYHPPRPPKKRKR
jgi:hypothetical protein